MRIRRDEAFTGLLVVVTLSVLVAVLFALGAPGGFRKPNTYELYFDNAGGIKPGTQVFLAGRQVGQVTKLESPVPLAKRPAGHEECEALIEISVRKNARIYNDVTVRMQQYGLLGQQMIDFTAGDEQSGLARSGTVFVGERVPGLTEAAPQLLEMLGPVAEEAQGALSEMRATLVNLNGLTGEGGDLNEAASNARQFTDTIKRQPWRLIWKSKNKDPKQQAKAERGSDEHHD
jgi:ABC-type transporter Mla subunit MlaD